MLMVFLSLPTSGVETATGFFCGRIMPLNYKYHVLWRHIDQMDVDGAHRLTSGTIEKS